MFVSTLEEIAKGNRDLFKDFWIKKPDYSWKKHPIIKKISKQLHMGICFGIGYELHIGLAFHAAIATESSSMSGYTITIGYDINKILNPFANKGPEPSCSKASSDTVASIG